MTDLRTDLASMNAFVGDYADNAHWETWKRVEAQAREAERMRELASMASRTLRAIATSDAFVEKVKRRETDDDVHRSERVETLLSLASRDADRIDQALAPATGGGE